MKTDSKVLIMISRYPRRFELLPGGFAAAGSSPVSLKYLVEEMLANGATNISIPSFIALEEEQDIIKEYPLKIKILDGDKKSIAVAKLFIKELLLDLRMSLEYVDLIFEEPQEVFDGINWSTDSYELKCRVIDLIYYVPLLLCAIQHKTHIDINLTKLLGSVNFLRNYCQNNTARYKLALFEGLLKSYRKEETTAIQILSKSNSDQIVLFKEILLSEIYQEISSLRYYLGLPQKIKWALSKLALTYQKFMNSEIVKKGICISSNFINLAWDISISPDLIELLQSEPYFPPIISLDKAYRKIGTHFPQELSGSIG